MASTSFVGEEPAEPATDAAAPSRLGVVAMLALVLVGVAVLRLGAYVTPFHYADALVVVAVAVGPALLVLAGFSGIGGRLAAAAAAGRRKQVLGVLVTLLVLLVAAPGNIALWANQRFDRSPAVTLSAPVVDMWTRRWRHYTHHLAGVDVAIASPLGRFSLDGPQPIEVTRAAYGDLVPGRTRFVLRTHRGALGFPWFERDPQQLD